MVSKATEELFSPWDPDLCRPQRTLLSEILTAVDPNLQSDHWQLIGIQIS